MAAPSPPEGEILNDSSISEIQQILHELRFQENLPFRAFILSFAVIEFLIGFAGNLTVLVSIIKFRFMRNTTNAFLFNLALTDLLILLFCLPWTFAYHFYPVWLYGQLMCKLTPIVQCMATCLSIYSLVSISVRRFLTIYKQKVKFSRKEIVFWVLSLWIFALAISSPLYPLYQVQEDRIDTFESSVVVSQECVEYWGEKNALLRKQLYTVFIFLILYVIPLGLMSIFYGIISWKLLRNAATAAATATSAYDGSLLGNAPSSSCLSDYQRAQATTPNFDSAKLRQELAAVARRKQATRMMMTLLAVFAVCWLPFHILSLYIDFAETGSTVSVETMDRIMTIWYPVAQLCGYFNTVLDPFCLLIMSPRFRRCLRLLLRQLRKLCASSRSRQSTHGAPYGPRQHTSRRAGWTGKRQTPRHQAMTGRPASPPAVATGQLMNIQMRMINKTV